MITGLNQIKNEWRIEDVSSQFIIGADEVGWGSIAGTIVVAGVKAPKTWSLDGLNDSKKLSDKKRMAMRVKLLDLISKNEIQYHMAERTNIQIDKFGAGPTLKDAFVEVFHKLYDDKCLIVCDGTMKFDNLGVDDYNKISLIKADAKVPAVMAASILAKTHRDEYMKTMHKTYPIYEWDKNVGYGAKVHIDAIKKYGPCALHRYSYAPLKNMKFDDPAQLHLFK